MTPDAVPPTIRGSLRPSFRRRLDSLGIALAGLCALHCLATLVVISALGLGGHFLLDENIHRVGLLLALGVEDVDEKLADITDEDGRWVDPRASAGQAAVDAFRRGEDPAALVGADGEEDPEEVA